MPTPCHHVAARRLFGAAIIASWPVIGIETRSPATPGSDATFVCDVIPRSRDEIATLLADPGIATPAPTTGGETLPQGIPASTQTVDAIEQVVRTWLACQNAGEPFRAWALFSDGYLYRLLSRASMPDFVATGEATPGVEATGGASLLEIQGERRLPDGRHGAIVTVAYPSVPMPKTFFFYFTQIDGRLLIDGILGEISFSVP